MLRIIRLRLAWVFVLGGGGLLFSGDGVGILVGVALLLLGGALMFAK